MSPDYTHTFEMQVGSESLQGFVEFDVDGVASFQYDSEHIPGGMTLAQAKRIPAFFEELKRMFDAFGSITEVEISEI